MNVAAQNIERLPISRSGHVPSVAELKARVAQASARKSRRGRTPRKKADGCPPRTCWRCKNIGYFDIVKPRAFGGYEYDFDVLVDLNIDWPRFAPRPPGSVDCLPAHQWLIASFPEQAQRDVWDANPEAGLRLLRAGYQGDRLEGRLHPVGPLVLRQRLRQRAMVGVCCPSAVADRGRCFTPAFLLVPASDYPSTIRGTWLVLPAPAARRCS